MERERGFSDRDVVQQCLLLGEEVGELFKAVRKCKKMRIGTTSITVTVDEELADVLIYLCVIGNRLGVSIDEALDRRKPSMKPERGRNDKQYRADCRRMINGYAARCA